MELWDLIDINRKPLNKTHERGKDLPEGAFHVVVEVWTTNGRGQILLTQRHESKTWPLFWECTGGSILTGETSLAGAIRELYEETGIIAEEKDLIYISSIQKGDSFYDSFVCVKDISEDDIVLQEGETVAAKLVTIDELHKIIGEGGLAGRLGSFFLTHESIIKKYVEST